ncbi:hypothetical protein FSO04_41920 [Paraburkholderia madseniana]|uniref:Uncharacterized protein n=1 Tax=Paraburkholderia madseniana TaxID=2599607 RepID=A0A6N6W1N1_9BURK|nr:hypothetical protein FSO04_41920 [Paraburkholderia madseniana]
MKRYAFNWVMLSDRALNVAFGGSSDETMSSRAGKGLKEGKRWCCVLCRFLDLFQKDHCLKSINPDDGTNAAIPD